jgi:hypothetical protein
MRKRIVLDRRETYFVGVYRGRKLHAVKIGLATRGKSHIRIKNLQTGTTDRLKILAIVFGSLERKFHIKFVKDRMGKSEFFRPTARLLKLIRDLIKIRDLVERVEALHAVSEPSTETARNSVRKAA